MKDNKRSYLDSCLTAQGSFDNSSCLASKLLHCAKTGSAAGYCICQKFYYYDTILLICRQQKLNGISCSSTSQCRTDLGLSCISGSCQCTSSKMYWSSSLANCSNFK
jgi:hypothetical protein